MTHRLNRVLLLLFVLLGLPFGWLMLNASTSDTSLKPVTIGQLRRLAAAPAKERPLEMRYETVGERRIAGDMLAAGSGLRPMAFMIRAYQLVLPQGRTITIDRGMDRALAEKRRVRNFDPLAQGSIDRALSVSALNLLLSPDAQHSGHESPSIPALKPERHLSPFTVAPGVVVLPTPGISPGKQMVYVRLRNGREWLFAGDIAPFNVAWQETRPPARFRTSFLVNDDREEIAAWLRTIAALKAAAPSLQIVAGHDAKMPRELIHGFTTDPMTRRNGDDKRLAQRASMR